MRMKRNINYERSTLHQLIQYRILRSNIIKIVWQTVRRITAEILGVKGLTEIRRITLDRSPLLLLSNNCFFFRVSDTVLSTHLPQFWQDNSENANSFSALKPCTSTLRRFSFHGFRVKTFVHNWPMKLLQYSLKIWPSSWFPGCKGKVYTYMFRDKKKIF